MKWRIISVSVLFGGGPALIGLLGGEVHIFFSARMFVMAACVDWLLQAEPAAR